MLRAVVLLAILTFPAFGLAGENGNPAGPPLVNPPAESRIPWNAAEDMRSLAGRWRMVSEFADHGGNQLPMNRHGQPIIENLFGKGAVLKIKDGKYQVEGSRDSGSLDNAMNEIEFRPPDNRWINTAEPRISFDVPGNGSRAYFSYVVTPTSLAFRFPANSCSRSGIRFTLVRINDEDGETVKASEDESNKNATPQ